ncbi:hypothetical protein OV203_46705 [Nannocystis sp. ILAH1]|uniref:hypothetical protein n=1 Tax=Nannocystis sp. ILAH1 TaxID=2996789 RepID=UPI002271B73D|nr:hypothetical protein [Nannocystis sp. ILAH1]MCY0994706.1 hypothetical protein [Nannocystis sp. ILAH1]
MSHRTLLALGFLLAVGCGPDEADTCRPLADLSSAERAKLCETDPWNGPADCPPQDMPADCESLVSKLVETCASQVDTCEYTKCAEALPASKCGTRPTECSPITKCLNEANSSGTG